MNTRQSFSLRFLTCLQEIDHNKKGYLPMGEKKKSMIEFSEKQISDNCLVSRDRILFRFARFVQEIQPIAKNELQFKIIFLLNLLQASLHVF